MKRHPASKNVLIVPWLAGSPGRKHLAGILRYVNTGHPWNVKILGGPEELTADQIRSAAQDGVDGMLVCATRETAPALAETEVPTVLMDFPPAALHRRKRALTLMYNDDEGIGGVGADYLLALGRFASYAFVPDPENRGWSRLRERGFKKALAGRGLSVRCYGSSSAGLPDWLKALPRPAAVMAAYDFRAQDVLEACRQAKLTVPDQVTVLGVDNDELLCDYAVPPLSSINIDHEAHGYESAAELGRLMSARRPQGLRRIVCPPGTVVERASTKPVAPASALVERMLNFIDGHATQGISVNDVVAFAGVSRRLAELRFAAATGNSIRRAIEDRRLQDVQKRLAESDLSITALSRLAGYAHEQRLKYVFRKRFGVSMREWRQAHRPC